MDSGPWTIEHKSSAQQSNGEDCGVFVLVTAIFALAKIAPPSHYDCTLWRVVLQALVKGKVVGEESEKAASGYDRDLGRRSSSKSPSIHNPSNHSY